MTALRPVHYLVLLAPVMVWVIGPWVLGQSFFHEDIAFYFHGLRSLLRDSPSQWNPWLSCGLPFMADLQSAYFYPLSFPYRVWPVEGALMMSVSLHLILGTWFWVRWLASWRLDPWAIVFSGWVWLWSGFFWNHLHHLTFLSAGVWIPAVLWALDATRARGGLTLVWPAACVGMMWLAGGSPQVAMYGTGLALVYGWVGTWREGLPLVRGGLGTVMVVVLGLCLAAVVVWPGYLASQGRYLEVATYQRSTEFSLSPLALGRLLVPQLLGNPFFGHGYDGFSAYWEEAPSVGLLTLPLLFMARAVAGWRRVFFGWVALLGFLGMFGTLGGVHPLLYHLLPGYGLLRAPNRLHLLFTLGAAVMAALALHHLVQDQLKDQASRASKFFVILGGEGLLLAGLYLGIKEGESTPLTQMGWALAVVLVGVGGYFLRRVGQGKVAPGRIGGCATLILVLELGFNTAVFNRPMEVEHIQRRSSLEQYVLDHPPAGRLMVDDSAGPAWLNAGMDLHIPTVRGYNPINSREIASVMAIADGRDPRDVRSGISLGLSDLRSPVLNLLSPSMWVSRLPAEQLPPELVPVFQEGDLTVYRQPLALPLLFFPGPAQVVEEEVKRGQHIREVAAIRPVPLVLSEGTALEGTCGEGNITVLSQQPDRVVARVVTEGPCYLANATAWQGGWSVVVDSYAAPLLRAWEGLQAVWIPAGGSHVVTFQYETPGLTPAKWVSAVAWLGVLLAGIGVRAPGRRQMGQENRGEG